MNLYEHHTGREVAVKFIDSSFDLPFNARRFTLSRDL